MSDEMHNNLLSKPCTSVVLDSPWAYNCALIDYGCIAMNSNLDTPLDPLQNSVSLSDSPTLKWETVSDPTLVK